MGDTNTPNTAFGYALELDVVFGQADVAADHGVTSRDLMLDVYSPADAKNDSARPAVVLVHGGAHHRGGRRQPPFREHGAVHSRMEDYARLLAPLGYVCFVIEYRLAPEGPSPRTRPGAPELVDLDRVITDAGLERVNFARRAMGLRALVEGEKHLLWNAVMAGAEDTKMAVEFVQANAGRFNIDPSRIALGGHSAGGGNTLNAAFGLKAPVRAIFPLSPPGMAFRRSQVIAGQHLPATLLVIAQNDIPAILEPAPGLIRDLRMAVPDFQTAWVAGFPHFYPTGAVTLADDGTRMSVGERVVEFLDKHLGAAQPGD